MIPIMFVARLGGETSLLRIALAVERTGLGTTPGLGLNRLGALATSTTARHSDAAARSASSSPVSTRTRSWFPSVAA